MGVDFNGGGRYDFVALGQVKCFNPIVLGKPFKPLAYRDGAESLRLNITLKVVEADFHAKIPDTQPLAERSQSEVKIRPDELEGDGDTSSTGYPSSTDSTLSDDSSRSTTSSPGSPLDETAK